MLKTISPNKNLLIAFCLLFIISCVSDNGGSGNGSDQDHAMDEVIKDNKPSAVDDVLNVDEDSSSGISNQIAVSENDSIGDDGGDGDDYSLVTNATHGIVTEISDGVFEYIPNYNFDGVDSFTYDITDVDGDKATATVNVTINAFIPTAEDFNSITPDFPSFTYIDDTTPLDKKWVKLESMSDEFDVWDSNKWFKSIWDYESPVNVTNSNTNSGVADGKLWIKATLDDADSQGRWFHTARIHSKAETSYPMYVEASIKTSHISAYNTFWLNKGEQGGIFRDEIDIIENNSNPSCTDCQADIFPEQMNSQYFHADDNLEPKVIRNKGNFLRSNLSLSNPLRNVGWNEDYHIYGVWWKDEKSIQFYLDGEPAGRVVVGEDQSGSNFPDRFFTRELEIIFDVWTNAADWLGGLPPKSDLADDSINTMGVDWVRTWKLEDK